jgi:peptidoglycan/LPS O-acetylase OafA/YrhL
MEQGSNQDVHQAAGFRLGYHRSFDGLRGVSILLVIATHEFLIRDTFGLIGVDVFFVLSGFLITGLLLEEWDRFGKISLRSFYARRASRLLPALYTLVIAFVIFCLIKHEKEQLRVDLWDASAVTFYYSNWIWAMDGDTRMDILRHTWSLGIEEQFYLVWPLIFWLVIRRKLKTPLFNYLLLAACCCWLLRAYYYIVNAADFFRIYAGSDSRADALLLGCAIAVGLARGTFPPTPKLAKWIKLSASLSVAGLAITGCLCAINSPGMICAGWFFVSLFAASIILELAWGEGSPLRKFLESAWLVYIGRISYGLYLWHWPVWRVYTGEYHWPLWKARLVATPVFIILTLLSYYLLERPCLRFKERFKRKRQ